MLWFNIHKLSLNSSVIVVTMFLFSHVYLIVDKYTFIYVACINFHDILKTDSGGRLITQKASLYFDWVTVLRNVIQTKSKKLNTQTKSSPKVYTRNQTEHSHDFCCCFFPLHKLAWQITKHQLGIMGRMMIDINFLC